MFKKNPTSVRLTLRALGYLLSYPDAQLRSVMPQLIDALQVEQALTTERMAELEAVCQHLAALDPLEAEARYVDNFDRGRQTSLHLFEHVHGDSRDRGPALIDLLQTYEKAGLQFNADELPDHLPVVLEFASTQPPEVAKEFLGEMAHILNALFSALVARNSLYASVIAAVRRTKCTGCSVPGRDWPWLLQPSKAAGSAQASSMAGSGVSATDCTRWPETSSTAATTLA